MSQYNRRNVVTLFSSCGVNAITCHGKIWAIDRIYAMSHACATCDACFVEKSKQFFAYFPHKRKWAHICKNVISPKIQFVICCDRRNVARYDSNYQSDLSTLLQCGNTVYLAWCKHQFWSRSRKWLLVTTISLPALPDVRLKPDSYGFWSRKQRTVETPAVRLNRTAFWWLM